MFIFIFMKLQEYSDTEIIKLYDNEIKIVRE